MELAELLELVKDIDAVDVGSADRCSLAAAVGHVQRLMSWCESRQIVHAQSLAGVASFPEKVFADAARTNLRGATRVFERVEVVTAVVGLGDVLARGETTGEYVDAVGRAIRSLEPEQRPELLEQGGRLSEVAKHATFDEFVRVVRDEVQRIQADDGASRLERQRRATQLKAWFDKQTGMWKITGEFDPATGLKLAGGWTTRSLHSSPRPCPKVAPPTRQRSKITFGRWRW